MWELFNLDISERMILGEMRTVAEVETTHMALEGMHPTLRHVPPKDPRFSMQAVCPSDRQNHEGDN